MTDSYIILNRKTNFIIKIFIINVFIIGIFVIWSINTFYYQTSFQFHSKLLNFNSFYYLEVLIPVKEVQRITKQNKIIIDEKVYTYEVYKVNSDVLYVDNKNCQLVYLEVFDLEEEYLKDGYEMNIKILKEKKKIIDYFKE